MKEETGNKIALRNSSTKILLLILVSGLFLISQESFLALSARPQQGRPLAQYEVTVTLKLVQVYVTDKKGNPVLDLNKEDFVVYDNGKKQRVTEFEKHLLAVPGLKKEDQGRIIEETPSPPARELMGRRFFLFFDYAYNNPQGILKAKEAALRFIDTKLRPSDEVGILSYSGLKTLSVLEYLTADHQKARQAVAGIDLKETAGRVENLQEKYYQAVTGENPLDAGEWGKATLKKRENQLPDMGARPNLEQNPELMHWKFEEKGELHALVFSDRIKDLALALRYVPGQKHLVLFSSGVPYSLIYGLQAPYGDIRFGSFGESLLKQKYEDMLKELNASNCIIYALNTEEIGASLKKDLRTMGTFTLQKVANATGGKYFSNIYKYEQHIEKIQNLTGCFYVVGYSIDEKWDGAYHNIKVEVSRPGCEVNAQKGYFNPKLFKDSNKLEKMLHLVDLALSEEPLFQKPVRFLLTAMPWPAEKGANLCLIAQLPLAEMEEVLKGKVEIITLVFDEKETIVELTREEKTRAELPSQNFFYYSYFSLQPGAYKCRLIIRNLETGRGAVAGTSSTIERKEEKGIRLFPPLFLIPGENASYMRGFVPKPILQKSPGFSLADYFYFDAAQHSPYLGGSWPKETLFSAVIGCSLTGLAAPAVTLSASLGDPSSGEAIPLTFLIVSEQRRADFQTWFVNLQLPDLPAGEYALVVSAEEKTSQSISRVTKTLRIL